MTSRRRMLLPSVEHVDETGMITDGWDKFISIVKSGKARQYYELGNYIPLDLGEYGVLNMEILFFNPPWLLADRSATPHIVLFSKELINGLHTIVRGYNDIISYLQETIFLLLPQNLQDNIPEVIFPFSYAPANGRYHPTSTKLWILNYEMVNGSSNSLTRFINWGPEDRKKYQANGSGPNNWILFSIYSDRYIPGNVIYVNGVGNFGNMNNDSSGTPVDTYFPLGFCL